MGWDVGTYITGNTIYLLYLKQERYSVLVLDLGYRYTSKMMRRRCQATRANCK